MSRLLVIGYSGDGVIELPLLFWYPFRLSMVVKGIQHFMFEQFITRLLGMERFSVSNRLETAAPSVIVKKDSTEPIPEKYKKDIAALQEKYGNLSSLAGLSISLTLKEALEIMPRNRRRVDAYEGLKNYLKRECGIELLIQSQKTKQIL